MAQSWPWNSQIAVKKKSKDQRTKDPLLIDKIILAGMAWIDYKKAYNMVFHSWLKICTMFRAAENMQMLLVNSTEK